MKKISFLLLVCISGFYSIAQNVGIGTNDPKSKLEVNGSFATKINTVTGATTLDHTYSTVVATPGAGYTITLPSVATANNRIYTIIYNGTPGGTAVTIAAASGQNISVNGVNTATFSLTGGTITMQNNGSVWIASTQAPSSGSNAYIQNNTVGSNLATGQNASFDVTGNGEVGGTLNVSGPVGIGNVAPGSNLINVSTAANTSGSGNGIVLNSQQGGGTGSGGNLSAAAGDGSTSGTGGSGGSVTVTGGSAQGSGNNNGGTVNVYGGNAKNTGAAGNINLTSGNGAGSNSPSGSINLTVGTPTGAGATGSISLGGGDVNLNNGTNYKANINTGTSTGDVNIGNGNSTQAIGVGNNNTGTKTVTIGGTAANSAVNINAGTTGGVTVSTLISAGNTYVKANNTGKLSAQTGVPFSDITGTVAASNIAGGVAGRIPYQSAAGTTTFTNTSPGTTAGMFMRSTGASNTWDASAIQASDLAAGVNGTTNTVAKFTAANTVGNSSITDNGSAVATASTLTSAAHTISAGSTQAALVVNGTTNPTMVMQNAASTKLELGISTGAGNFITGSAVNDAVIRQTGGQKILFSTSASGATNDLTLTGGNVGIGTAAPGYKLDVNGAAMLQGGGPLYLLDANHGIKSTAGQGVTVFTYLVPNGIFLQQSTGNVGIGNAAPGYRLEVSGSFRASSVNVNGAYTLPTAAGTTAQFLRGDATWAAVPSSADNLGNHTATTGLTMGANSVNFTTAGGPGLVWGANYSNIYDDGDLRIKTDDNLHIFTNSAERMTITADGTASINNNNLEARQGLLTRKRYTYFTASRPATVASTYTLGSYDLCSLAGFSGYMNGDDDAGFDLQCNVFIDVPSISGIYGDGQGNSTSGVSATVDYDYNTRPSWKIYVEAYRTGEGYNGNDTRTTCNAICITFDY